MHTRMCAEMIGPILHQARTINSFRVTAELRLKREILLIFEEIRNLWHAWFLSKNGMLTQKPSINVSFISANQSLTPA